MSVAGSEFLKTIAGLRGQRREDLIFEQFLLGNTPEFMREWSTIPLAAGTAAFVRPDFLCIGTDADYVRIPMWPLTAQRVADLSGDSLTTRRLSNLAWHFSIEKLDPQPWGPPYDASMEDSSRIEEHNRRIESKRGPHVLGELAAGHKKDVGLSATMPQHLASVFIYGWHQKDGKPIQPLFAGHPNNYADYSHGIRLVMKMMLVNGVWVPIADIMQDPKLCHLVSDEGPLPVTRIIGV